MTQPGSSIAPADAVVELGAALYDVATRALTGEGPRWEQQARWLIDRRLAFPPSMVAAEVALAKRMQAFTLQCAVDDRDAAVQRRNDAIRRITAATGNYDDPVEWARRRAAAELTPAKRALANQVLDWVREWVDSVQRAAAELAEPTEANS